MRYGPTAILLACLSLGFLASPSHAGYVDGYGSVQTARHGKAYHGAAVARYGAIRVTNHLPSICYEAMRKGGPCGCWASIHVFGHSVRELWLANNWLRFRRTSPHAGAVAVWPGRHVAPIVGVPRPGYITVADSWATHDVSVAGKIIVEPR